MKIDCFLDTNILIYAVSANDAEAKKRRTAIELLRTKFAVSTQVLQEFYATSTRKPNIPLTPIEALTWLEMLEQQPCAVIDPSLIKTAIATSQRFRIAYWDAAIIAAAELLGAETLFTEDLNHGQSYGSVRVINPFL